MGSGSGHGEEKEVWVFISGLHSSTWEGGLRQRERNYTDAEVLSLVTGKLGLTGVGGLMGSYFGKMLGA